MAKALSPVAGAARIFDLSLGELIWSRRTIFMALVVGAPVVLATVARLVQASGIAPLRVNGVGVDAVSIFGMIIWVLFLRFIIPVRLAPHASLPLDSLRGLHCIDLFDRAGSAELARSMRSRTAPRPPLNLLTQCTRCRTSFAASAGAAAKPTRSRMARSSQSSPI